MFSLQRTHLHCTCTCVSRLRNKSSLRQAPVRHDVTSDAHVNNDQRQQRSGTEQPQIDRQMDELDRHRQTAQKMSNKVVDLHTKVCDKLHVHIAILNPSTLKSTIRLPDMNAIQELIRR